MMDVVEQIMANDNGSTETLSQNFQLILDMARDNGGFNAHNYAAIINEIAKVAPSVYERLTSFIDSYKVGMDSLIHMGSHNYGEFCSYVKRKDQLKGSLAMIKAMQMVGVLPLDVIVDIASFLVEKIYMSCKIKEKVDEVSEFMEHLYLLATGSIGGLCGDQVWRQILFPRLLLVSRVRKATNGNCGVSSRANFRCQDIMSIQAVALARSGAVIT